MQEDKKLEWYLSRIAPLSEFSTQRVKKVLNFATSIKVQKGRIETFLDIGCSDGTFTILLQEVLNAEQSYGIEISSLAAEQAESKGIKVDILNVENEKVPYEDETFDAVFACDIIEHLFDSENILKEIHRILKNKGALIISTPNLASWYNRVAFILGFQPFGTACSLHLPRGGKPKFSNPPNKWGIGDWGGEHIRVMTLSALKDLLRFHNFVKIEIKGASGVLSSGRFSLVFRFVGLIDTFFSFFPCLSTWIVVKAIKESA